MKFEILNSLKWKDLKGKEWIFVYMGGQPFEGVVLGNTKFLVRIKSKNSGEIMQFEKNGLRVFELHDLQIILESLRNINQGKGQLSSIELKVK